MDCYTERAHLLALLATDRDAYLYEDDEGEEGFRTVVAIRINGRYLCWHLSDADAELFIGIGHVAGNMWDGHTTEEKYAEIREYIGLPAVEARS